MAFFMCSVHTVMKILQLVADLVFIKVSTSFLPTGTVFDVFELTVEMARLGPAVRSVAQPVTDAFANVLVHGHKLIIRIHAPPIAILVVIFHHWRNSRLRPKARSNSRCSGTNRVIYPRPKL